MKNVLLILLKGMAMGAANVIPGISGGTIAFITGIYERLINALKHFDLHALRLLLKCRIKELLGYIDFYFLFWLFAGIGISIISLARFLEWAFCTYEIYTLSFFFGLILASVLMVGKEVNRWNFLTIFMLIAGVGIAVSIGFFNPAQANDNFFYLVLCGIVAISSMILPGLSGSYVLLIMGNYLLVMNAVYTINLKVLIPLALGCIIGLFAISHIIAYIFEKFRDGTVALLTGFVLGSLLIIWPWKHTVYKTNELGQYINKKGEVITDLCRDGIVVQYQRYIPEPDKDLWVAVAMMVAGVIIVLGIDYLGRKVETSG